MRVAPDGRETPWGIGWKHPSGLAVDSAGNLYVADSGLFKLTPAGAQSTIAFDPAFAIVPGADAITRVAVDLAGDIFIMRENGPSGFSTVERIPARQGEDGKAVPQLFGSSIARQYFFPSSTQLAVDAVGDAFLETGDGVLEVTAGGGSESIHKAAGNAISVAVAPSGNVFMAVNGPPSSHPYSNRLFNLGHGASGTAKLLSAGPSTVGAIAADAAGNIYIAAGNSDRVLKRAPDGVTVDVPVHGLDHAFGLAVNRQGDVYIADSLHDRVLRVAPDGVQEVVGHGLDAPVGLAVDRHGNLYVADSGNNRVVEIAPSGRQTTIAAGFSHPFGVAVDHMGDVFVADTGDERAYVVRPDGSLVPLPTPRILAVGIAVDAHGYVYLTQNRAGLLKVAPGGFFRAVNVMGLPTPELPELPDPPAINGGRVTGRPVDIATSPLPTPYRRAGRGLYLLTASCREGSGPDGPGLAGPDLGLYYATSQRRLAGLRGLGFSGCDLDSVRDEDGHLYIAGGFQYGEGIQIVHEAEPQEEDRYAWGLWTTMGVRYQPTASNVYIPSASVSTSGRAYFLLGGFRAYHPAPFVSRFLADAEPDRPRVQPGSVSDYANMRFGGQLTPGLIPVQSAIVTKPPGGEDFTAAVEPKGLFLRLSVIDRTKLPLALAPPPPLLPAGSDVFILAATSHYLVVTPTAPKGPSAAWIFHFATRTWSVRKLSLSRFQPTARIWGDWLVTPDVRTAVRTSRYTGALTLTNLANGRSITLNAGTPDAEVLDITGVDVVYRVQDRIFLARISGNTLGPGRVLVDDPVADAVHWAFWSKAVPHLPKSN